MLRVKLRCGDRSVIMAYSSMADVLTAASDRLGCRTDDVILKMNIEGDNEPWEIEGEPMLQSAVEDGHVILAFSASTIRPPMKKRARTDADHAGPSSLSTTKRVTQPILSAASTPLVRRSVASAPAVASSSTIKANSYLSSGGESADEGKADNLTQRSSKKKWTEKEDRYLWSSLDTELKTLPSPNPVYTRDERKTVFERLMLKHPKRFVGRTAAALRSRVRSRVLDQRKENKKLPARINALFPVSRSWNTAVAPKASQAYPGQPPSSTTQIVRSTASTSSAVVRAVNERPAAPSTSSSSVHRATSAPVPRRRPFVADVIRLRAIENAANNSPTTQSTNTSSGSSSDEDIDEGGEGRAEHADGLRATSGDITSPQTPSSPHTPPLPSSSSPGREAVSRAEATVVKTEALEEVQLPSLGRPVPLLSHTTRVGQNELDRANRAIVKAERTFVFCAPTFQPPSDATARAEPDIRAKTNQALFDSPDKVLIDDSTQADLDVWAAAVVDGCMEACSELDTLFNNTLASQEQVSYVVFVVLDEIFRQNFALARDKCSSRKLACAMAVTFAALRRRFGVFEGFDMLFCRFLRQTLFSAETRDPYASMYVAAIVLLTGVQTYESVLDGIFFVPWSKAHDGRHASSNNRLDEQSSRLIFVRMAAFVDSLESMASFVISHPLANSLFRQLPRAPKFKANAWQRVLKETTTDQPTASWPERRQIVEHVRSGMLNWNTTVVQIWTSEHSSARSLDSAPARNTRSNASAVLVGPQPSSTQNPLFRGLPDLSQGENTR